MPRPYLRYLLIGLLLYWLAPAAFYYPPAAGLDSSYIIATHLAQRFGLVFGKDVVFTFGPLGILNNRYPIGVSRWVYLLFDVYFLVSLFFLLKKGFEKTRSGWFLVIAMAVAFYEPPFQWYFVLFLFYLFYLVREPENSWAAGQAILLALLSFFYKVNLGVVALLFFLAALYYLAFSRKIGLRRSLLLLGALLSGLLGFSILLRVDLRGYLVGSWHLIDAYNDAMLLPIGNAWWLLLVAGGILLLAGGRGIYLLTKKKKEEGLLYVVATGALFVLFKSGFVRSDTPHISHFFNIVGLVAAVVYVYSRSGICWVVLGFSFLGAQLDVSRLVPRIGGYWRSFAEYPGVGVPADGALRKVVGEHTVDVVPSEISKIYFNGLRYDPRPVVQSYSAYDAYLDSLNYQKYMSPGAPDFILFSFGSIDDRCAFFDEPKTRLAIVSHYVIVGEVEGELLLKKKELSPLQEQEGVKVVRGRLGEDIAVDSSSDLQYARIYVDYSIRGRLRRWVYKPPMLTITLLLEDGERKTYRTAPPMLADGIWLDKFIDSKEDFQLLLQSGGKLGGRIRGFRLGGSAGFVKEFRMEIRRYRFPEATAEDSAAVARLNAIAPVGVDTAGLLRDTFYCWAEWVRSHSPLIQVEGWVRKKPGQRVGLVLRSATQVYALYSEETGDRQDVEAFYKWPAGSVRGYKAKVSRAQLPPGKYQVGVSLYDASSGARRIRYLDNWVMGRAAY